LQYEVDRLREERERDDARRERERKESEREMREKREYALREAYDWMDALGKQIILCQRECNDGYDEETGRFFGNTIDACKKAQEIWREVEGENQAAIDELEAKIAELKDSIRTETADRLEAADARNEFAQVAEQIRNDDLNTFLDW
jgi:molybdopterin converting factor small subunit